MKLFASAAGKDGMIELSEEDLEEIVGGWHTPSWARKLISMVPIAGPIYTTIEDISNMSGAGGGSIAARVLLGALQVAIDVGTTVTGTGIAGNLIKVAVGKKITEAGARFAIGGAVAAIRSGQGYVGGVLGGL